MHPVAAQAGLTSRELFAWLFGPIADQQAYLKHHEVDGHCSYRACGLDIRVRRSSRRVCCDL